MKFFITLLAATAIAGSAFAASPEEPVKVVMDLATALWSDDPAAEGKDYFDEHNLGSLYSKKFVDAYRAAAKFPVYDESATPFGYDVITNGQDGCPLKDVKIEPGATTLAITDVKVTFKLWTCVTDGSVNKDELSEVHFTVVEEGGKPVIDDIHRVTDGKQDSLIKEMQDIVKTGSEQPKTGDDGDAAPPKQN